MMFTLVGHYDQTNDCGKKPDQTKQNPFSLINLSSAYF